MPDPNPNQLLLGFTAGYDKASNRLFERHLHHPLFSHLYPVDQYDSANRLLEVQRGKLDPGATPPSTITIPEDDQIKLKGADTVRSYDLDLVGNWNNTAYTAVGETSPTTDTRQNNNLNQTTQSAGKSIIYDTNGNMSVSHRIRAASAMSPAARASAIPPNASIAVSRSVVKRSPNQVSALPSTPVA
ncbi:hypothetical protein HED60_21390 [Planctomycetales bacterium ZRK34]|nr:hypothetical protein HED60_21390 [Planctomycetales bacterium ZRK34]